MGKSSREYNMGRRIALETINDKLKARMREGAPYAFLGFPACESASVICGYLCYDTDSLKKGGFDAEEDVRESCEAVFEDNAVRYVSVSEIKTSDFNGGPFARQDDMFRSFLMRMRSRKIAVSDDYMHGFTSAERIVPQSAVTGVRKARAVMKEMMPSDSLRKEVDRIFDKRHPRDAYYGIPVHYKITASSDAVADSLVDFLVQCLYKNKRLLSTRVTKISNIESGNDRDDFEGLLRCAAGSVVQIVLTGDVATSSEYASKYIRIAEILEDLIKRSSGDTLFFLVENVDHPGFADQLTNRLAGSLDIMEIKEGRGSADDAKAYFRRLVKGTNVEKYAEDADVFEEGRTYTSSETVSKYLKWRSDILTEKVYSAYQNGNAIRVRTETRASGEAYRELQAMIGLSEVKGIVDEIIASCRMEHLRSEKFRKQAGNSRHMVFTGDPGTAKTTVARLLAEILKDNNVLGSGAFVECGRQDLVGQYVGWTAKLVQHKFEEARGGILFIDEAYSLVDDRAGMYGDEAINTIVQQMENMRDEVIVIFAGYPKKMQKFLSRNEGLRSRISFHVDFPDYTPDELLQILDKLSADRGFTLDEGARAKALTLFQSAAGGAEFGNGRYVRNLLEQAVNRQAVRLMKPGGGPDGVREIPEEALAEIRAEDLDTNAAREYVQEERKAIGF